MDNIKKLLDKWVDNGVYYDDEYVKEYYIGGKITLYGEYQLPVTCASLYTILFGPSNIFEVMFGEKDECLLHDESYECDYWCFQHDIKMSDKMKQKAVLSKDPVQYILDNSPLFNE